MPLVYDFNFSPDYAGQSATVVDDAGAGVDGSPVTLDANGDSSLSLDEGNYTATTSNANLALNNAHTVGVLNLAASVAAGGGGSPLVRYQFECNESAGSDDGAVAWDTAYDTDGYTGYEGELPATNLVALPPGRYAASFELWLDNPATDRIAYGSLVADSSEAPGSQVKAGHYFIPATCSGAQVYGNGVLIVPEDPSVLSLALYEQVADTTDTDPVPITITYALLYLDWLGTL